MSSKELVVKAIHNGTVIDHIPANRTLLAVELLTTSADCYFIGVNLKSPSHKLKGIIKIQDKVLNQKEMEILAALAPDATVNIIENYGIISKKKLKMPNEIVGVFVCNSQNCITNKEAVTTRFKLSRFEHYCCYCERSYPVEKLEVHRPNL